MATVIRVSNLFLAPAAKPRPPRRRFVVAVLVAGIVVVAAVSVAGVAFFQRGTIPAGTTIGGVDVGGLTRAEAESTLTASVRARVGRPIRLLATGGEEFTSGNELGARPLLDGPLDEALDAGHVERLLRRVGIGDAKRIELLYRLGPVRAAKLANRLDQRFGEPPLDADLVVTDTGTTISPPAPGTRVDRAALRRGLGTLPAELGVALRTAPPAVGIEEARRAQRAVERLLDAPREVRFRDVGVSLPVATIRRLVVTEPRAGKLVVGLDPAALRTALEPGLGRFEVEPLSARFEVDGDVVRLVPSAPGRRLDGQRIAASLSGNLTARVHRAWFSVAGPSLTTKAAKQLRITELVSAFTTNYPCCAPRVTNIKRAAELLDGTVLLPGNEFSLNQALGERTEAKGFVTAPQIFNGRFEDAVGGGISQVATTLFNAAFFSGIKLVAHRAHQFYISRYPMGREATVSWGGPELIFRNDWPAAILIKVDATDTGITARFYSTKLGRRVATATGEPYDLTRPKTVTETNAELPRGARKIVQEAGDGGFKVDYTRRVFRDGKLIRNERYTHEYDAEDEIVEIGPST